MMRSKLAAARYERGLSQEDVAELVQVSRSTVSEWERGRSRPYPIYVERLCKLFHKTTEELDLEKISAIRQTEDQERMQAIRHNILTTIPVLDSATKHTIHETVEAYRNLLPTYWDGHYTKSRPGALPEVEVIIADLCRLIIYGNAHQQQDIQLLLCQYHQFATDVARDTGNLACALSHANLTILLASKMEMSDLLASALYRRGLYYFDAGDVQSASADLHNALPFAVDQQLQGMVALESARFSACLAPDRTETVIIQKLLDRTQHIVDGPLYTDTSYVRLNKGRYHIGRGATLLALKQPANARSELDAASAMTPSEFQRRHAYIKLLQARSYLLDRNFDYAAEIAVEAATKCVEIQSKSNLKDLAKLHEALLQTPYKNASKVTQLGLVLRS